MLSDPPVPTGKQGIRALAALVRTRDLIGPLSVLRDELGDIYRIPMKPFNAVVLSGAEANDFVHLGAADKLSWRPAGDPVSTLLRHGILMEDGPVHDRLRSVMHPTISRQQLPRYVEPMWRYTDQEVAGWKDGDEVEMLHAVRRIALLIVMRNLFGVDLTAGIDRLLPSVEKAVAFISPGSWVIWPRIPRIGFARPLAELDDYLYGVIRERRRSQSQEPDLLGALVADGLSDDLIRDQMMTMLIAGHDTSTSLLAWMLYLLGRHPGAMANARDEVDRVLGSTEPTYGQLQQLDYLDRVAKEALRLYPPIHIGTRTALEELEFQGHRIPKGTRILYSIYLSHRDKRYWPNPSRFDPDRFLPEASRDRPHGAYVPYGGGARSCIGLAFCQVEARAVIARLLQLFNLTLTRRYVRPHMGATLEPRPGVFMRVERR